MVFTVLCVLFNECLRHLLVNILWLILAKTLLFTPFIYSPVLYSLELLTRIEYIFVLNLTISLVVMLPISSFILPTTNEFESSQILTQQNNY